MLWISTKRIKEIVYIVANSNIEELETSFGWGIFKTSIKIKKFKNSRKTSGLENKVSIQQPEQKETPEKNYILVKSTMVGTFYYEANRGNEDRIKVGDKVEAGKPIGYIEAMKTMSPINLEVDGIIKKILVENGQPIQFGTDLVYVEPFRKA